MHCGVFWSGKLEYDGLGLPANVTTNDYANVQSMIVGRGLTQINERDAISECSDLFVELPKVPTVPLIAGHVRGNVHLPEVDSTTVLRVDGGLLPPIPPVLVPEGNCTSVASMEPSPRGNAYRSGRNPIDPQTISEVGAVRIDGEHKGQIVLHAAETADGARDADYWGASGGRVGHGQGRGAAWNRCDGRPGDDPASPAAFTRKPGA
jgi:hypothetical protein